MPLVEMSVAEMTVAEMSLREMSFSNSVMTASVKNGTNCTGAEPPVMSFTFNILLILLTYAAVFTMALIGNVTMFCILVRNQLVKVRRVHSLLLHMNIAHLIVTLIYMPKEMFHNYMIEWLGGDLLCRLCKFFDVFGVSLSANILICISLDRFYSIFFPFYAMRARRSVNQMVVIAWIVSFLTSGPQFLLFRTAVHPCFPWYTQCVAKDFIKEVPQTVIFYYSVVNITQVYLLPLVVIVICYSLILFKISAGRDRECGASILRRSTATNLERARSRTLRMTLIVVAAFLFCWTPYAIQAFLHFSSRNDQRNNVIPRDLRKFLYAFAVFNSAITPYLYGYFSFDLKKELRLLARCSKATVSERHLSHSTAIQRNMSERTKRSVSTTNLERDISSSEIPSLLTSTHVTRGNSLKAPRPVDLIKSGYREGDFV